MKNGFTRNSSRVAFMTDTVDGFKNYQELFAQNSNKVLGNITYFECFADEIPTAMIRDFIFRDYDPNLHGAATPEGKAHDEAFEKALCCHDSGYKKASGRKLSYEMWEDGWRSEHCPIMKLAGKPILRIKLVNFGELGTDEIIEDFDFNPEHQKLIEAIDAYIAEKKAIVSLPPADETKKKEKKEKV